MKITNNYSPIIINRSYNSVSSDCPRVITPEFKGVSQVYDKFCQGVGKHFCRHVFDNKLIDKIAYSIRNSENAVKHFLAVGSVITSGMYMRQTLTNDKMDKDRRVTLATNQLFTLLLSTLGAYTLDSKLKNWWSKKHEQFIKLSDSGKAAWAGMESRNEKIKTANKKINKDITEKVKTGEIKPDLNINETSELKKYVSKFIKSDKDGTFTQKLADLGILTSNTKDKKSLIKQLDQVISEGNLYKNNQIKEMVQAEDYIRKLVEPTLNIDQYLERYGKNHVFNDLEKLQMRSKGFGALRSILVFGFIYRFFVPLAVVKPTNYLCEKIIEKRHQKAEISKANSQG